MPRDRKALEIMRHARSVESCWREILCKALEGEFPPGTACEQMIDHLERAR